MATMMLLPMFHVATLKLRPILCGLTHIQFAISVSDPAHTQLFFLFFPTCYFIRHMSTLAGMLKIAWRVGRRRKKEEAIVGEKPIFFLV